MKTKELKLTQLENLELLKLIYKINNLGEFNSMVRTYFDINTKKEWKNFIKKYSEILEK